MTTLGSYFSRQMEVIVPAEYDLTVARCYVYVNKLAAFDYATSSLTSPLLRRPCFDSAYSPMAPPTAYSLPRGSGCWRRLSWCLGVEASSTRRHRPSKGAVEEVRR
jgi:hypothetical protein